MINNRTQREVEVEELKGRNLSLALEYLKKIQFADVAIDPPPQYDDDIAHINVLQLADSVRKALKNHKTTLKYSGLTR